MHVSRIGLTPLKGARHSTLDEVELTPTGAVGDRVFCLVDVVRERVLRTIENPVLPGIRSSYDGERLTVSLPDGRELSDRPAESGEELKADYWGRTVALRLLTTSLDDALSEVVGTSVRLARAEPGEVVYGGAVSIVTTTALRALAGRLGGPLSAPDARFRSTFTVDDTTGGPDLETLPPGTRLSVGGAELELRGRIPRCGAVDLDPVAGGRPASGTKVLGALPVVDGEPVMGADARVVRPGVVRTGDPVALEVG